MNICVIGGAGYVGLITGLGLAEIGHQVVNFDIDCQKITRLQEGLPSIYEPELVEILRNNLESGSLCFSSDLRESIDSSDIIFVAVGTPIGKEGDVDLSALTQVAEDLADHIEGYKVLSIRSTVPPGAIEQIRDILCKQRVDGQDFDIVVNPEFLREGQGLHDFLVPARIVSGSDSEKATLLMQEVYEPIIAKRIKTKGIINSHRGISHVPIIKTNVTSAQMIKYTSNAFLAARVSFINEIAGICEMVEADIEEVAYGIGFDPRIGHSYLHPGLGFGGPCIEKDLRTLINSAEQAKYDPLLLKAVLNRNDKQIEHVVSKVRTILGGSLKDKVIAALGLAFKSGTNDVRNSLPIKVVNMLVQEGVILKVTDPKVGPDEIDLDDQVLWCRDAYEAGDRANALLILTEWDSFKHLDYLRIKSRMATANIVDSRNLLDSKYMKQIGFDYIGVGIS